MKHPIFDDLFVLELANNHEGDVRRGLRIIAEHARVVQAHGIKATIKLQLRDVPSFVNPAYRDRQDIRYVSRTMRTALSQEDFCVLAKAIRDAGCLLSATPFDEASVEFANAIGCDILKIASSDINDRPLIEAILAVRRPVIASTGGSSEVDVDNLVSAFEKYRIPLALNHCVSLYPTEDAELDLNQIDFLRRRYPDNVIGFSTHEYRDWRDSMLVAYAKGARTFERHIDLPMTRHTSRCNSMYCSAPEDIGVWFDAWKHAVALCGGDGAKKRIPPAREVAYLDSLVRGAWAARDLPAGHVLRPGDVRWQIPLLRGQLSCREDLDGVKLSQDLKAGEPLMLESIIAWKGSQFVKAIGQRGLEK